ncbi:MAG: VOC family protein [Acidimicrobiales bacterium]
MPDITTAAERSGEPLADDTPVDELAWPPSLTPYIVVGDARRAIDWYVDVFGAARRGEPYVMPDGSIGHAELGIGDAVLMLAEGSSEVPVQPPAGGGPFSHTIHAQVDDVDRTVHRARDRGAGVEREAVDEPYGRVAVIVDPFGHRWMLNTPPASATRVRPGDVAHVTMIVADDERAKEFYGAVLGWQFSAGSVERGWNVPGTRPMIGIGGDPNQPAGVQLCFRVVDIDAIAERVRRHGGEAADVTRRPYGLLVECVDDQGAQFQLWQPADAPSSDE